MMYKLFSSPLFLKLVRLLAAQKEKRVRFMCFVRLKKETG